VRLSGFKKIRWKMILPGILTMAKFFVTRAALRTAVLSIYSEGPRVAQKILVVEDEFLSRNNLCKFLAGAGYIVRDAANGAEALEKITSESFDLVITDFVMPHVDGLRLIELMRGKWPHLPTILVTGYLSPKAGHMILENKAAEILTKPLNLDDLLNAVKRSVGKPST